MNCATGSLFPVYAPNYYSDDTSDFNVENDMAAALLDEAEGTWNGGVCTMRTEASSNPLLFACPHRPVMQP